MTVKLLCGIPCLLLGLTVAGGAAAASSIAVPAFAAPLVLPSDTCSMDSITATLSPDKRALSVLRKNNVFVQAPAGSSAAGRARCRIDFVFAAPLKAPATLRLDVRGAYIKQANAEISYELALGSKRHQLVAGNGEMLGGEPTTRRFHMVDLPAGTAKVRLDIAGKARSLNRRDQAEMHIDSLDLCFLDSAEADDCGGDATATSASAATAR